LVKPEGRRPFGSSRHKWEDNIKMYIEEIRYESVNWIYLALDRDQW
jgi:hypothetical protein